MVSAWTGGKCRAQVRAGRAPTCPPRASGSADAAPQQHPGELFRRDVGDAEILAPEGGRRIVLRPTKTGLRRACASGLGPVCQPGIRSFRLLHDRAPNASPFGQVGAGEMPTFEFPHHRAHLPERAGDAGAPVGQKGPATVCYRAFPCPAIPLMTVRHRGIGTRGDRKRRAM